MQYIWDTVTGIAAVVAPPHHVKCYIYWVMLWRNILHMLIIQIIWVSEKWVKWKEETMHFHLSWLCVTKGKYALDKFVFWIFSLKHISICINITFSVFFSKKKKIHQTCRVCCAQALTSILSALKSYKINKRSTDYVLFLFDLLNLLIRVNIEQKQGRHIEENKKRNEDKEFTRRICDIVCIMKILNVLSSAIFPYTHHSWLLDSKSCFLSFMFSKNLSHYCHLPSSFMLFFHFQFFFYFFAAKSTAEKKDPR